jgi:predicted Rossmann-fold nucleotide-binding protein
MNHLSADDIERLTSRNNGAWEIISGKFRICCLGILGAQDHMHNTDSLPLEFPDFRVQVEKHRQSIKLIFEKAPGNAFVDGQLTRIRKAHIAAAIRDMVYQANNFGSAVDSTGRSRLMEKMIEDAGLLDPTRIIANERQESLRRVVVQGGHTVGEADYEYCKQVGEELGLRMFEVITGGGPGTMRGALKGNRKGLNQQKIYGAKQIGLTAPEIIAAEPPNIYVTDLAILPNMEGRLESFVRLMHAELAFPGGAGTAEEILIKLGIKLDPKNQNQHLPMMLTAHRDSMGYIQAIEKFLTTVFGRDIRDLYEVKIGSPDEVARWVQANMHHVLTARDRNDDAYEWNRSLHYPEELQKPFEPTLENVANLEIHKTLGAHKLGAELRKLFKAIVYGSITAPGRQYIGQNGKYQVRGDREILDALDMLLQTFIEQKRMRSTQYEPCYELLRN